MVGRGRQLPQATRQGKGERCASCSSSPDQTGLANAVEFLAGVQQCWSLALSLLDRRAVVGVDGDTPSASDVVGDIRHVPLSGFA